MLINVDLPADLTLASPQSHHADTGAGASQMTASTPASPSTAGQLDPSLQRLTNVPATAQDPASEIQDGQGARLALDFLRQSMSGQPGTALTAQANQLSQNVLSLLQSID
jgi:hypothetical protein